MPPGADEQKVAALNALFGTRTGMLSGAGRDALDAWLAAQKIPVHAGAGAMPFLATILRNHRTLPGTASAVTRAQWRLVDGDSVWVEPIDYPDAPGSLLLYVPSLRWAYSGMAAAPLQVEYLMRRLRERGFEVEKYGSLRGVVTK